MASYQRSPRRIHSPFTSPRRAESPKKSPRRLPLASPSRSLFGLEKAVHRKPSFEQTSYRSWDSTPKGSSTDANNPLPQSPTRSRTSSVYSGGSGYTKIIDSYGDDEESPLLPAILRPTVHRDTAASLLQHREDATWCANRQKVEKRNLRPSQSILTLQYTLFRDEIWNASAHEISQAPAFSEFRNPMHGPVSPISSGSWQHRFSRDFLSPPLVNSKYHLSYDHERHYLPGPISASVTEVVDPHLVPQPLRMSKTASMVFGNQTPRLVPSSDSSVKHVELLDIKEAQRRAAESKQRDLEARAAELVARRGNVRQCNLIDIAEAQRRKAYGSLQRTSASYEEQTETRPKLVSSDSFVIYTGHWESVKAMIKQKLTQKKESREIEKAGKVHEKERKRIMSLAQQKCLSIKNIPHDPQEQPRKYSWNGSSGRASLTDGVSNLFRNLSVSKTQRAEEEARGRNMKRGRRPKQLAFPPSPYQRYGAEVWFAKNRKAKKNLQAKGGIQRAPTKKAAKRFVTKSHLVQQPGLKKMRSEDMKEAYQQGASQLRTVLGVHATPKKEKEKKGHKLLRSMSKVRRERLKRSIAVLGPARQPVATEVGEKWL